jgi:hypothetical protein
MDFSLKNIGGRKFALVLVVFLFTAAFAWFDLVTKADFISLTKMLLVAYPAGAVAQAALVKTPENSQELDNDARKFIFSVIVFLVTAVLLGLAKINGSAYMELCQWIVGIYITGNVMAKAAENGVNYTLTKTQ